VLARATAQHDPSLVDGNHDGGCSGKCEKPQVGGDLIVAAARRMQTAAGVANDFDEPALHVHVDVFQGRIHPPFATLEFTRDLFESGDDPLGVLGRDQSDRRQHTCVRLAAAHVVAQEAPVESHTAVERGGRLVHGDLKPCAATASLGRCLVGVTHRPEHYQGLSPSAPSPHYSVTDGDAQTPVCRKNSVRGGES
jgi:hypothetical protein